MGGASMEDIAIAVKSDPEENIYVREIGKKDSSCESLLSGKT